MPIRVEAAVLLSLKEAAEISPYSAEYLNLLVGKGKIKAQKIGRDWMIAEVDLFNYLKKQISETKSRQKYLEQFVNSSIANENQ